MDTNPPNQFTFKPDAAESPQPVATADVSTKAPLIAEPMSKTAEPSPVQSTFSNSQSPTSLEPTPVVKVLSPRGVEYVFLTVSLFLAAIGLASTLIALVNNKTDFSVLALPTSILVVSVPLFGLLFMHTKRAELNNPNLKLDPSKRRSTQFTQIVAFLVSVFTLIGFVTFCFAKSSDQYKGSLVKIGLDALVLLVIAGGIGFYYWLDEHRQ